MKQPDKDQTSYNFALDRFEGDKAVLIGEDKVELILPKKILPKSTKEGSVLVISITPNEVEAKQREKTARELLNEILNAH